MRPDEIRLRMVYLFLACSQLIEQLTHRLAATFPNAPLSSTLLLEKTLRRELGLLFRYWATHNIWERLAAQEADAKSLNLVLLRLFVEGFKLPKDGSGLRYAELLHSFEEVQELHHRFTNAFGMEHPPLLLELQAGIVSWRNAVFTYTQDALDRSLPELTRCVQRWSEAESSSTGE